MRAPGTRSQATDALAPIGGLLRAVGILAGRTLARNIGLLRLVAIAQAGAVKRLGGVADVVREGSCGGDEFRRIRGGISLQPLDWATEKALRTNLEEAPYVFLDVRPRKG